MSRDGAVIARGRAAWPITFEDVLAAEARIRPYLPATPLRAYAELDAAVGHDVRALVKHENHNPTNAFKVRNGLSVMTALTEAVGAMTVIRALKPDVRVYGVQAEGAPAIHDAWHRAREEGPRGEAGAALSRSADTFADGLATRSVYEATFPALCEGLAGFITVTEREIAAALRLLLRTTHNLAEGAGAASLAGLRKLAPALEGKVVAIVLSGSNIDQATLRRILLEEI